MNKNELYLLKQIVLSGKESGKFFVYWKNSSYKVEHDVNDDEFRIVHSNGTSEFLREAHESKDFHIFNIDKGENHDS